MSPESLEGVDEAVVNAIVAREDTKWMEGMRKNLHWMYRADGSLVFQVPKSFRYEIFHEAHKGLFAGHFSAHKLLNTLRKEDKGKDEKSYDARHEVEQKTFPKIGENNDPVRIQFDQLRIVPKSIGGERIDTERARSRRGSKPKRAKEEIAQEAKKDSYPRWGLLDFLLRNAHIYWRKMG
ncbi:hypothetical protein ANCCEY_14507 [Ancylostoma ceylanicum]|uniref:Integrase zinc-binding domain-containing protein n=1 Tax=Ancylostoma ceylanicum TaxID=53326 RepID=A0A0D6LFH2_9BILA|nr:hypothetical protein ANCCEY_14507 [Ancylostoma ceylanicum]